MALGFRLGLRLHEEAYLGARTWQLTQIDGSRLGRRRSASQHCRSPALPPTLPCAGAFPSANGPWFCSLLFLPCMAWAGKSIDPLLCPPALPRSAPVSLGIFRGVLQWRHSHTGSPTVTHSLEAVGVTCRASLQL